MKETGFQINNMWAVIDVNEGRIEALYERKKDAEEHVNWLNLYDNLNDIDNKYIIKREDKVV